MQTQIRVNTPPQIGAFVRPAECFTAASSSIAGLIYQLDGRMDAHPHLIRELPLSTSPTRGQVMSMLVKLRRLPSPADSAAACIALLHEVTKDSELLDDADLRAALCAPDTANVLRPLRELLVNDAPWILARVHTTDVVHVAHGRLSTRGLARALRVRLLSEAVVEELDDAEEGMAACLGQQAEARAEDLLPDALRCGSETMAEVPAESLFR